MNKYQVTRQSGETQFVEGECFEFDWKSKDIINPSAPMNAIFYSDIKKYHPVAYLSKVLDVKEIPVMGAN